VTKRCNVEAEPGRRCVLVEGHGVEGDPKHEPPQQYFMERPKEMAGNEDEETVVACASSCGMSHLSPKEAEARWGERPPEPAKPRPLTDEEREAHYAKLDAEIKERIERERPAREREEKEDHERWAAENPTWTVRELVAHLLTLRQDARVYGCNWEDGYGESLVAVDEEFMSTRWRDEQVDDYFLGSQFL